MTAKEWIFENYPQVKDEWNKTGHDDNYMVRMMEEYHQAKLKLLDVADVSKSQPCDHEFIHKPAGGNVYCWKCCALQTK